MGLVLFLSPPAVRLWIAVLVIVMAFAVRGKAATGIIDKFRQEVYGQ